MKQLLLFITVALMAISSAGSAAASDAPAASQAGKNVKITLTIAGKMISAVLYDTAPTRDLAAKLPVTVSLNRGPVDYCGGISPVAYNKEDVSSGYHSGDLAYWIPGQDFVIFTKDEDPPSQTPDLVILGQVRADMEKIRALGSTIRVTIALGR